MRKCSLGITNLRVGTKEQLTPEQRENMFPDENNENDEEFLDPKEQLVLTLQ